MLEILKLTPVRYRHYISLRYGINPWGIYMSFSEIADLLGIRTQALMKIVNRGDTLLASKGFKASMESQVGPLPSADKAKRARREHKRTLDRLSGIK